MSDDGTEGLEVTDVRIESWSNSNDRLIIPHPVRERREDGVLLTLPDAMTKAIVYAYHTREIGRLEDEIVEVLQEGQKPVNDGRIDWNDCGDSEGCE